MEQLPAELHGSGWAVQAVQGTLDRFRHLGAVSVGGLVLVQLALNDFLVPVKRWLLVWRVPVLAG
jgi:hypothetical protein